MNESQSSQVYLNEKGFYVRECPTCKELIKTKTRAHAINADKNKINCKSCTTKAKNKARAHELHENVYILNGFYCKNCKMCGKRQEYVRKKVANSAAKLDKLCQSCSNKKVGQNKFLGVYKGIRTAWVNKYKRMAEDRSYEWSISLEDIYEIFEKQNWKCAYSGVPLKFNMKSHASIGQPSLDRKNNKLGYTKENTQVVIKEINIMKNVYNEELFLTLCKKVSSYRKL